MERYWPLRLARAGSGAFEIDLLMPDKDGVTLDYRGYDGVPVRTHFLLHKHGEDQPHRLPAYQSGRLIKVVGPPNAQPRSRVVNRRSNLTPHRRPILTPLSGAV
jgi:hypothetical protein